MALELLSHQNTVSALSSLAGGRNFEKWATAGTAAAAAPARNQGFAIRLLLLGSRTCSSQLFPIVFPRPH